MNTINIPGFTAETSLSKTDERYRLALNRIAGTSEQEITPQQDFAAPLPPFYRCGPCVHGERICCPPPGFGAPCIIRRCRKHVYY